MTNRLKLAFDALLISATFVGGFVEGSWNFWLTLPGQVFAWLILARSAYILMEVVDHRTPFDPAAATQHCWLRVTLQMALFSVLAFSACYWAALALLLGSTVEWVVRICSYVDGNHGSDGA